MLRKIRIILAALFYIAVTLLFLGVSWRINLWLGWVAKIQFLPALMALNFGVLAGLIILTLLFGRLYCSIICPLGVMQDIISWFGRKAKKNRYSYSPEKKWLRYSVLAVFIVCLIIGFAPVTTLLAPYSAYGRIVNSLFRPLYDLLVNGLAAIENNFDSYMFSEAEIWMRSVTTFIVALLTLGIIGVLAWKHGRTYCNTVCPVGTILSFFARFSLFRIQINEDKCRKCSLCAKNCKAAAIDFKNGTVDLTRCVTCGDCIDKCHDGAISYKTVSLKDRCAVGPLHCKTANAERPIDESRRTFLTGAAIAVGTAAFAQAKIKVDGGLAEIEDKVAPHRETPITPPGSVSARNMQRHCTACQLCVSACPNNVLRPSSDPMRFMQPEMSFERGYCRPECTHCSQVCPTGAIQAIKQEDKPFIHIGHAVWIEQNCIPVTNGDHCGACAKHCPMDAIQMVEHTTADGRTVLVPAIDKERCIGCGKCEHLCPARPFSAIYVEGNSTHQIH
ncbi:MAG: 4Fe-4S binding protein [Paludibacteraceae bacterium]|nr:4Fe-4S binding protein [Paludibacteraceae bacterium]